MPLVSNIKSHDYQFEWSVAPAGKWLWTTRLDVSKSVPSYSIRDVKSPYGLLRDSIPIPGEVVQAMSASIDELRQAFAPKILIGPPDSISIVVDEGRGYGEPVEVPVTNDGVYGSLLGVSLTTSAPYVRVTPTQVGNLSMNESGRFSVEVDSRDLLASGSPYASTVTLQDPNAVIPLVTLPVGITVRPKATIQLSATTLTFTVVRPLDGAFPSIPVQTFIVSNVGPSGSVLEYDIRKLLGVSDWLTGIVPSEGTINSGSSEVVSLTVAPPGNTMVGVYTETLRVSGYSSNSYRDIQIQLVVT